MAKFYYGGQAVMEGVMMRGHRSVAVSVRRQDSSIYIYEEALSPALYQNRLFRLPFLRGMVLLWEMLVLGTRMMTLSANIASGAVDTVAPNNSTLSLDTPSMQDNDESGQEYVGERPPEIGGPMLVIPLLISLSFAVAIFFVGPLLLSSLLPGHASWPGLILEGLIRLGLLVGYLYLIGRVPDIQRVFGYHGAEHKAINAMESGDPLDVEHVRRASRVHTRCGTGFLLLVRVVSIYDFALVGSPSMPIKIVSRIVLVPVVAGIAYELMRLGAANYRYRVVRWLLAPGLALQGLTTREPDDTMIECSIASLKRVLQRDKVNNLQGEESDAPPLVPSA